MVDSPSIGGRPDQRAPSPLTFEDMDAVHRGQSRPGERMHGTLGRQTEGARSRPSSPSPPSLSSSLFAELVGRVAVLEAYRSGMNRPRETSSSGHTQKGKCRKLSPQDSPTTGTGAKPNRASRQRLNRKLQIEQLQRQVENLSRHRASSSRLQMDWRTKDLPICTDYNRGCCTHRVAQCTRGRHICAKCCSGHSFLLQCPHGPRCARFSFGTGTTAATTPSTRASRRPGRTSGNSAAAPPQAPAKAPRRHAPHATPGALCGTDPSLSTSVNFGRIVTAGIWGVNVRP